MRRSTGTGAPRRILFIRRDNIGDLVLVTPLIHAVRRRHPNDWIGVLGNSYNTPVLAGHPDVDALFAYDKAKHSPGRSRVAVYAETLGLLWRLRRLRIDLAVLAGPGPQSHAARLARWLHPREIVGFVEAGRPAGVSLGIPYGAGAGLHEAEDVFRLGAGLGVSGAAGPCVLAADPVERERAARAIAAARGARRVVAIHLSARRARQRWPAERFAGLMRSPALRDVLFVLLWSPGAADDPRHPGDDAKAADVASLVAGKVDLLPWPTPTLASLGGALANCDLMVCADGGAMHVAAGLGVPVVALFGDSPPARWRPWRTRSIVLQAPSMHVDDIAVEAVAGACADLLARDSAALPDPGRRAPI